MFCNSRTSRSVKEGLRDAVAIRWEIECKGGEGSGPEAGGPCPRSEHIRLAGPL